uniref:Microbial-type PARG catalytic domain-containing protein n=1 Tax=viral metagenome TaxID=1070528 RepID=A0A6C0E8N3_9ZZZZ
MNVNMNNKRDERVALFNETIRVAKKNNTPEKSLELMKDKNFNKKYDYESIMESYKNKIKDLYNTQNTKINVLNQDTIDVALDMNKSGLKPLVLNLASDYMPGGGCRKGAMAQEEQLYYCSDYDLLLGLHNRDEYYPLDHMKNTSILTKNVTVIRQGNYRWLDNPVRFDFLAIPALNRPILENNKYFVKDLQIMKKKIESIFLIAASEGYRSLLLGALGCGAYGNPVEEVVAIYKEMLTKYKKHFDVVTFAVLSPTPANNNFDKFTVLRYP